MSLCLTGLVAECPQSGASNGLDNRFWPVEPGSLPFSQCLALWGVPDIFISNNKQFNHFISSHHFHSHTIELIILSINSTSPKISVSDTLLTLSTSSSLFSSYNLSFSRYHLWSYWIYCPPLFTFQLLITLSLCTLLRFYHPKLKSLSYYPQHPVLPPYMSLWKHH